MEESLKEQGYSAKKMFEEAQNALSDNPQLVEGFGDEAFWISDSTDALHVLVGEVYFTVSTNHGDSSKNLEITKDVAEKVLSRLANAS